MMKQFSFAIRCLVTMSLLYTTITLVNAQTTQYFPTFKEVSESYKNAALMDSITRNKVYNANVTAFWNKNSNGFWYIKQLPGNKKEYRYIDARSGQNTQVFNQQKLAAKLSAETGKEIAADKLMLENVLLNKDSGTLRFSTNGQFFLYNIATDNLQKTERPHEDSGRRFRHRNFAERFEFMPRPSRYESFHTDSISPDKKWTVVIQNGNIYLQSANGTLTQYSKDGTVKNPYGNVAWSPDSKYFVAYHIHPVIDSNVYYILSSVPGTTRGQLRSHPYKQPGDPFTTYEMHIFRAGEQKDIQVKTDIIDFFPAPRLHWETNPRYFTYERVDRGHQRFRIVRVDAQTGDTSNVYDERTKTFIYEQRIITYYLPKTHEIIHSSEKDGWQHLYLIDDKTRQEKLITKGDWVVREVDSVDETKRQIWFRASGMNPQEDPYFIHYYRINFDGTHLVNLTPETGNHTVHFSPDKKFLIDNYSQVNVAPITVLKRTSDGKIITTIEKADITDLLATGVSLPEPFVAKGRDGVTDIYGIMCKPSHFDIHKKYPVIENIYAGPQDAFVPKSFLPYSEMQSIAELGFIVVQIDGMGTANRSKAFHDVCWKNIADAGFPDRILWIKALAEKYSFVDTARVGLYGTSAGGQDALDGLLSHPEFYKAGVAACGCHDNRIDKQWWNEQWMGYPVGPEYATQSNVTNAYKLKGKLMLIVGEADTNVPPESTYRVADALIKAGKAFDFLPVPGSDHTDGGPYGRARKKDFFVRNLLNVEPPDRNINQDYPLPHTGVR
ncbi:peptidase S9 [Arachidicoccus ginsenosidimutans]|uniref:S9 family peptidase n=1 Tax=Arachidicoccus sp. BS20 TaxID=1850526 RepID=UPI0007F10281|nr:S9 family peptidase [Arachidicoccus sp. BS20]ANI89091.1 peptidase S9 [Arachidicoccus sp. BS20]